LLPRCRGKPAARRAWTLAGGAVVWLVVAGGHCIAQETLSCGVPVRRVLADGEVHTYRFSMPAGAAVVVERHHVSGNIGLLRLRAFGEGGGGDTCTEELAFNSLGGETVLEVSDCDNLPEVDDTGEYTVVLNVVSDHANNCGFPLSCGATPDGIGLVVPGEVDSYTFSAEPGRPVELFLTEPDERTAPLRLRVFGPHGDLLPGADDCDRPLRVEPTEEGIHTVLVGACRSFRTGRYRLSFDQPGCPEGPTITYFGLTTADSIVVHPDGADLLGRPVYTRLRGQGLSLVIEARRGSNRRSVGIAAYEPGSPAQVGALPDLQVLVSRDLGDGNATVCDTVAPEIGGVPGSPDLDFSDADAIRAAVNDMGCRFDDGQGMAVGRANSDDACTRSSESVSGHAFVDPTTQVQFCAVIARPWAFPFGDTVVAARVRDRGGFVGQRREIVVRVTTQEATPTPTPTSTPGTPTPTPTLRPVGGCVADCDRSGNVGVNEVIAAVNIALGRRPMATCERADDNLDGSVTAGELVHAVANALGGCGPT
jgi:hypothetical protein